MSERMREAIWSGDTKAIAALVASGDDPSAVDVDSGWSGLMLAAENAQTESMRVLIDLGADPNYATGDGWTALHHVVDTECDARTQTGSMPDISRLRLLLASGADRAARYRGETPAEAAARRGWTDGEAELTRSSA
jgi:ankyrin repeat protein